MPTVKEIKKELDELGIDCPPKALKADLELLLTPMIVAQEELRTSISITAGGVTWVDSITDPNARPETQAK